VSDIPLLEGLATTRTIRRYTDDPIPDADLAAILWHATRAPSGSNRQPVRYLVLRDGPNASAAKSLLGGSFRAGWAAKRGADGY
jgi:nitroreductase